MSERLSAQEIMKRARAAVGRSFYITKKRKGVIFKQLNDMKWCNRCGWQPCTCFKVAAEEQPLISGEGAGEGGL